MKAMVGVDESEEKLFKKLYATIARLDAKNDVMLLALKDIAEMKCHVAENFAAETAALAIKRVDEISKLSL